MYCHCMVRAVPRIKSLFRWISEMQAESVDYGENQKFQHIYAYYNTHSQAHTWARIFCIYTKYTKVERNFSWEDKVAWLLMVSPIYSRFEFTSDTGTMVYIRKLYSDIQCRSRTKNGKLFLICLDFAFVSVLRSFYTFGGRRVQKKINAETFNLLSSLQ